MTNSARDAELKRLTDELCLEIQALYITKSLEALRIILGAELVERFLQHVPQAASQVGANSAERLAAIHAAVAGGHVTREELDIIGAAMEAITASLPEVQGPKPGSNKPKAVEKRRAKNRAARQQRKARR